ncbi:MAG: hypothetical protein HYU41_27735 [Candidatus Rokubacteria bacterium]|nr:hypothetical protein [Candidatus Rokubacteria bacterium]
MADASVVSTRKEVDAMPMTSPQLKIGSPSPCGCRVTREDDDNGAVRIVYCRTHGAAFDVLAALQTSAKLLERVLSTATLPATEQNGVETTRAAVVKTIHEAVDSYGYQVA